ncbi:MAG: aromatic amino acid lyase [Pseudomonadota bacterium]
MTIRLSNLQDFTLEGYHAVAWRSAPVELDGTALEAIGAARSRFMKLLDDPDVVIYGVTTGYGQNAKERLSPEARKEHAAKPVAPPAASWGDPVPERVARGIVFARLANFIEGHAGIRPELASAVAAMLDGRKLPTVPARGQGGAGEILSLSHLFLGLSREMTLEEKESLALVNGSPSATALVSDSALSGQRRLKLAAEVFALAFEGMNAPLTHLAEELDGYWNNAHDAWALEVLRDLIDGGSGRERRPYQAPVSFRIAPRILGQAHRAVSQSAEVAGQSLAAVSDNPVLLPPDDGHPFGNAVSTGGYHNAQSPAAMDGLTAAYANIAILVERMSAKLLDGDVSLLPPQLLGDDNAPYLGCLSMAATGYEEELRMLTQATLLPGSESGGFGQNDVASPVFLAWSKQERAGELLESALAALCPIALRALDVTGRPVPEKLQPLAASIREAFPLKDPDLILGPASGQLAASLREAIYSG